MTTMAELAEVVHRASTSIAEAMAADMRNDWPHVRMFFDWPRFVAEGRDFDAVESWCRANLGDHLFNSCNRCVVGIRDAADATAFEARWR